ncbi:LysM peptidoglycan-binding domain-containing protein [Winogradskyella echinorum]|uniref:LysM peptidoglycan-binding domain-containing protein n=1 Tax=Winogradskyella echinorum TaxID=538189 RepID=A0ABR6Y1Z0_9FLAO|nr:LysM peptidoglycan-binding domain-containing protein [Winogradskyella echinorum]MBC3846763.1 LysM peptidoglycan-binding domain-containing protein [Winogradskyella echinorum]MBC5751111.1 LysM peptidoglycan-binding domain-containing protein [Winogradskyella echinorum]
MKNILTVIFIAFTISLSAQNYKEHKVKAGETIESIAKQYLVTPFDIYALNPDAKTKFQPNTVLIIPNSKIKNEAIEEESRELIGYKKHKVKRKETLYGLSKKYNVSEDEIKKANRFLYSENLKKGDKIRIPNYRTVISKQTLNNTVKKYTVQPKEGKWRIAYKFGITVAELEGLNPNMNDVIQPGDKLNVPNIEDEEEKPIETSYGYYEVLPKEGFYRLKVKLDLTQEQLEELNPELKETGLKAGMVLKVPAGVNTEGGLSAVEVTNLKMNLKNFETKKIALMMPYRLDRIDVDAVNETKEKIKEEKLLSIVLDFHVGVLMALDSAKQLGISTDLKVFDTRYRPSAVRSLLDENDFSEYDAIIGPMEEESFDRVASALKNDRVPVIAAMKKPKEVYSNVFQTLPEDKLLRKKMIDFVKADSLKTKVVIISDQAHRASSEALKNEFPGAKLIFTRMDRKNKTKDAFFIYPTELDNVFAAGKTIVFLETNNNSFASSIISMLNALINDKTEIVLMTLDKNKAFEGKDIDNNNLSNLKFHYPSVNKDFDESNSNGFVRRYQKEYGVSPSKYAARGFDLTLDILMRLASEETLYDASSDTIETEYVENKFRYKKAMFGGYVNEAVYIVKYDNLRIVKAN